MLMTTKTSTRWRTTKTWRPEWPNPTDRPADPDPASAVTDLTGEVGSQLVREDHGTGSEAGETWQPELSD